VKPVALSRLLTRETGRLIFFENTMTNARNIINKIFYRATFYGRDEDTSNKPHDIRNAECGACNGMGALVRTSMYIQLDSQFTTSNNKHQLPQLNKPENTKQIELELGAQGSVLSWSLEHKEV
jgi:hypothetical protein